MKEVAEKEIKKDVILSKCFECLTKKGIESTTIRDFSRATKMAASSIYYWFSDKDEIVLDAVKWGLNENVKVLFDYAFSHTEDLYKLCEGIKTIAKEKKMQFRLIFQVATSPQYGKRVRAYSVWLENMYKKYTETLSKHLNMPFEKLYPFVKLFISVFIDCIIWDNWDEYDLETGYIIDSIKHNGE